MSISEHELRRKILEALKEVRSKSPERNFTEAVELHIGFKDIDLRRPENRLRFNLLLPHYVSSKDKIGVFADDPHIPALRELAEKSEDNITIIDKVRLEELKSNLKLAKKLVRNHRIFLSSSTFMSNIGKFFGRMIKILNPRNKMPIPIPINEDPAEAIESAKRTLQIRLHKVPVINIKVGDIKMTDEELAENIVAVLEAIKNRMPKGWRNIKSIHIKTTMGPPVKISLMAKRKKKIAA